MPSSNNLFSQMFKELLIEQRLLKKVSRIISKRNISWDLETAPWKIDYSIQAVSCTSELLFESPTLKEAKPYLSKL